jgi:hypothetical protein
MMLTLQWSSQQPTLPLLLVLLIILLLLLLLLPLNLSKPP